MDPLLADETIDARFVNQDMENALFVYELVYVGGCVPKAFMNALQLFPTIIRDGLTKHDTANIVA